MTRWCSEPCWLTRSLLQTQGCISFDSRRQAGDTVILFSCGGRADGGMSFAIFTCMKFVALTALQRVKRMGTSCSRSLDRPALRLRQGTRTTRRAFSPETASWTRARAPPMALSCFPSLSERAFGLSHALGPPCQMWPHVSGVQEERGG